MRFQVSCFLGCTHVVLPDGFPPPPPLRKKFLVEGNVGRASDVWVFPAHCLLTLFLDTQEPFIKRDGNRHFGL